MVEEYLSIGELASIFKVTVQLLRHYDKVGLLVPEVRDPRTGYRRYRFDQLYRLATIRYLRKVGYSLDKINDFLQIQDYSKAVEAMQDQSRLLKERYDELLITDKIIQNKLSFIAREKDNIKTDEVIYKQFERRHFIFIGKEDSLFTNKLFYFYPTIGFYTGDNKDFGAYIVEESQVIRTLIASNEVEISSLPAGKYACFYHLGPYKHIYQSIDTLLSSQGLEPRSDKKTIITINIIDQCITSHHDNYVTELQLPLQDEW